MFVGEFKFLKMIIKFAVKDKAFLDLKKYQTIWLQMLGGKFRHSPEIRIRYVTEYLSLIEGRRKQLSGFFDKHPEINEYREFWNKKFDREVKVNGYSIRN